MPDTTNVNFLILPSSFYGLDPAQLSQLHKLITNKALALHCPRVIITCLPDNSQNLAVAFVNSQGNIMANLYFDVYAGEFSERK